MDAGGVLRGRTNVVSKEAVGLGNKTPGDGDYGLSIAALVNGVSPPPDRVGDLD